RPRHMMRMNLRAFLRRKSSWACTNIIGRPMTTCRFAWLRLFFSSTKTRIALVAKKNTT
ncbi:hypothetical protein AAVH_36196, partial [Aphelenchoides avenae]